MWTTIYEYACFFLIYAFLGWCTEVVYAAVTSGEFVNRGFLNGPVCPIYGFGVVGVVFILSPVSHLLFVLYVASVLLTSLLEYITGYVLEKLFQSKWWDYTDKPFNIKGYVCLSFSLLWGFGAVFIVRLLHPTISWIIGTLPQFIGLPIMAIGYIIISIDLIVTVKSVNGLNTKLSQLEKVTERINDLSVEIGENLSKNTLALMEKNEEMREKFEEKREEFENLVNKQRELLSGLKPSQKRLVRAFPKLKNPKFSASIQKLKTAIKDSAK